MHCGLVEGTGIQVIIHLGPLDSEEDTKSLESAGAWGVELAMGTVFIVDLED
jgi:hypothetical protein